jgi:D-alanyl-D-alanine carboxypeptidase/D-alanyl-D-alanine-endopeptidase (penicillin-binding protein 4)
MAITKIKSCLSLAFGLLLWANLALAELPEPLVKALQAERLPADSVSVFVQQIGEPQPAINHRSDLPLNPASTMKLLTTYAGLELLGPAYVWHTEVYSDGMLKNGVLDGNLILKGHGDPVLDLESFWRLLSNLRQAGVREIRGDLVLDHSYFAPIIDVPGAFDGEPSRAYNAVPDALLVNLKATSFHFQGNTQNGKPAISAEPDFPQIKIINRLMLNQGLCQNWKDKLDYKLTSQGEDITVTFSGSYAVACDEKYLDLSLFDGSVYTFHLFRQLWQQLGGSFQGKLKTGEVPVTAQKLLDHTSPASADVIRRINKYSNNLMARQLLLTIAAERSGVPATVEGARKAINDWLLSKRLDIPELVLENGSGLSRGERISARHLGELLLAAYASPVMPELMSSLPVLSVDGTVKKRQTDSQFQGRAHLKTGSLDGVSALAGYMLDEKGRRWVIVFMANHARAAFSRQAQDALLEWVYKHE